MWELQVSGERGFAPISATAKRAVIGRFTRPTLPSRQVRFELALTR
jgi:hypothetical protein